MANSDDVPKYSSVALGNRDIFLGRRNGLLVYCEDEGFEEFYLRLLRGVDNALEVEDVFCLGGKSNVLMKIDEPPPDGKRRLFLVDKDFDDLLNKVQRKAGLVYLERYSIENYFIEERHFVDFVVDRKRRVRRATIADSLSFSDRLNEILVWYERLCRIFVVSQKFNLKIATTKVEASEFFMGLDGPLLSWLEQYKSQFLDRVYEQQAWLLEDELLERELERAFEATPACRDVGDGQRLSHMPGKHLVEMLLTVCNNLFGCGEYRDVGYQFLMSAASRVDEASFCSLRGRISEALQGA